MSETAAGDDLLAAGAGNPEDVSWLSHELSRFGGISAKRTSSRGDLAGRRAATLDLLARDCGFYTSRSPLLG